VIEPFDVMEPLDVIEPLDPAGHAIALNNALRRNSPASTLTAWSIREVDFLPARRAGRNSRGEEFQMCPCHLALGFEEVGAAAIHGGAKTVRYLRRALSGDP
jgi:hypothetical protein